MVRLCLVLVALVSNPQWQTVARNSERAAVNWHATTGTIDQVVGVGMLARGHSDGSADGFGRTGMNSMLAADPDDANGYLGTGQSATDAWDPGSGSSGGEQLRTQRLSNGEVVWDLAGNGWEWVSTSILGSDLVPSIGSSGWREFTDPTNFPATSSNKTLFGPAGQLDSQHGVGQLYGGTANELARGHWGSGGQGSAYAGVFSLGLNGASGPNKTFRCVYR